MNRLAQKRKEPSKWKLPLLAFVVGLVLAFAACHFFLNSAAANETICDEQDQAIVDLKAEVKQLEYDSTINQAAIQLIKDENKLLESHVTELENNLRFYKNILEPNSDQSGLIIQKLRIMPEADGVHYRYFITLTQNQSGNPKNTGKLDIEVKGDQNGKTVTLPLAQLTEKGILNRKFAFKYFQEFEGELILPNGFLPEHVILTAKVKSPKSMVISKTYPWQLEAFQ